MPRHGSGTEPAFGVYVHIPFCASRCDYCDFFVIPGTLSPDDARGFFELLGLEARQTGGQAGTATDADTLYLGGGTPSFVPPQEIARFVRLTAQKARLVVDLIRDKPVEVAMGILQFTPKRGARTVLKTLRSAVWLR